MPTLRKSIATLTIAGATLVTGAGIASAQEAGTPGNPLPNGLCLQPGRYVPFHVPCDSPEATTPYVAPDNSHTVDDYPEDPTVVIDLGNGVCRQIQVHVPRDVPCAPAVEEPVTPAAPVVTPRRAPRPVVVEMAIEQPPGVDLS